MSHIAHAINSVHAWPWAERIGKLILNFSNLEFESVHWLVQFSEQPDQIAALSKPLFGKRVKKICEFISARPCSNGAWQSAALAGWTEAMELAKMRNRIAHNPLVFAWNGDQQIGEPDYIGIVDMKLGPEAGNEPLLSRSSLDTAGDSVAKLVVSLAQLRHEWCVERDAGRVPPLSSTSQIQ